MRCERRHRRIGTRQRRRIFVQDRVERVGLRDPLERPQASQHLVEHDAEAENVGAVIEPRAPRLLRRHVGHGADDGVLRIVDGYRLGLGRFWTEPRHRRRRRLQGPRAGCRTARPHHRRARRRAPSRGRGLRQGGVGKSTLTLHLAGALRARGLRIAILDADFNGPSQARMAGVQGAVFVPPGSQKVALPADQQRHRRLLDGLAHPGVGGARLRERGARRVPYLARHEGVRVARPNPRVLRVGRDRPADVRPAARSRADRPVLTPTISAPRTSFVLVTIPSEVARGVVARSVAALSKGPNRVLGYVENMSGYYCRDCNAIKPLFEPLTQALATGLDIPCLGTVPFDPELARHCDRGNPSRRNAQHAGGPRP